MQARQVTLARILDPVKSMKRGIPIWKSKTFVGKHLPVKDDGPIPSCREQYRKYCDCGA